MPAVDSIIKERLKLVWAFVLHLKEAQSIDFILPHMLRDTSSDLLVYYPYTGIPNADPSLATSTAAPFAN